MHPLVQVVRPVRHGDHQLDCARVDDILLPVAGTAVEDGKHLRLVATVAHPRNIGTGGDSP